MASGLLKHSAKMADLDQTEICQLKQTLAGEQTKIKHLEELKEVDKTQIVILQARVDELTKLVEAFRGVSGRSQEEKLHDDGIQQEAQTNGSLYLEDVHIDIHHNIDSPIEDEGVGIDLNGLDIDGTAKDGQLSVSDSGFEGNGSDGDSDIA
ncbi:hypothetical protein LX32DRAFT_634962 [Colletotrichum zoysiae]|uniref:Uncharacterized protein n=1 Tax=Colletotrichum zoysiae TaxID=1216348 RepID=A0AAD9HTR4_9PEZI|nr:hypothetical protein LX32DRAFT_634962 [Colletotrichum zoysiae]